MRNVLLLSAAAALLLAGCIDSKAQCDAPKATCNGWKCTNLETDPANCGACGNACAAGQVCIAGTCGCSASTLCGSTCADTRSNPNHCGGCGQACETGELCQDGACVFDCSAPKTQCELSCVDLNTDSKHCGACGNACAQGLSCEAGVCRSVVYATCFNTGELVSLDDALVVAPATALVGAGPYSIASTAQDVLVGDTMDNALYSFDRSKTPPAKRGADRLGKVVNQVLVRGTRAYAINSGDNNVQVIDLTKPLSSGIDDARSLDEIRTGLNGPNALNTSPAFGAFVGERLFVTLTGTCDDAGNAAGNRVLDIALGGPTGTVARDFTYKPEWFEKDEGVTANSPRPAGIASLGSRLYVAIGNLNPDCVGSAGPGYLSILDTADNQLKLVENVKLPNTCRNPAYVLATPTRIYISCPGSYGWGATADEGLIVLNAENGKLVNATQFPRCSPGAPATCRTAVPGRLALHGDRLLIADNNAGRLLVTDLNGNLPEDKAMQMVELCCPPKCDAQGNNCYQLTSDVFALH